MESATVAPLVVQLGVAAVFIYMLYVVYTDGKEERAMMLEKLDNLDSIKQRITRIEDKLGIDDPPTLLKPPQQ